VRRGDYQRWIHKKVCGRREEVLFSVDLDARFSLAWVKLLRTTGRQPTVADVPVADELVVSILAAAASMALTVAWGAALAFA
jgi:hypothetical protein